MHIYIHSITDLTIDKNVHDTTETHVLHIRVKSDEGDSVITMFFDKEYINTWHVIGQLVSNE